MFRAFNVLLAISAFIGIGWVVTLPNRAQCAASGRVVDPSERHCEAAGGYVQLREHALFHSREVALGAALLWVAAYLLHRRSQRRSARADS